MPVRRLPRRQEEDENDNEEEASSNFSRSTICGWKISRGSSSTCKDFYCELRLRANRPFDGDAADAAKFKLTPDQAQTLQRIVAPLNAAAAAHLQKAYDRLKEIDGIRK